MQINGELESSVENTVLVGRIPVSTYVIELKPIYDTRQSFYRKAQVQVQKNDFECTRSLYSYGTLVASIIWNYDKNIMTCKYFGKYSQTTTRHQKEFFRQEDLSDEEIKELFKNGVLELEVR